MDILRGGWAPGLLGNGAGLRADSPSTGGYDAATDAIAAAFTTPPTTARKNLIDAAVVALKAAGVWTKLDALYAFAAADSQAAKINWVNPGTYNATEVNAPAFAADLGFTGASTKYLDSGFNPNTAPSPKWVNLSACAFGWSVTNLQDAIGPVGDAVNGVTLLPRHTSNVYSCRINTLAGQASGASTDSRGLWAINRTGASAQQVFWNGAGLNTDASAASGPPGTVWFLQGAGAYWLGQIACGGFGQSLSGAEQTALYNALNTYLAGVGAVSSYQAETNAIAAAFTTPPTTARKNLIDACVVSLKSAGVWTKLDALYAFAAADSQAALINWKQPGTYNGTLVNAPAFTADRGFTGASTKYIDPAYNPTTASSPQYVRDSASAFGWALNNVAVDAAIIGTTSYIAVAPRWSTNVFYTHINTTPTNATAASADSTGFWLGTRTSSSLQTMYKNGVSAATDSGASLAVVSEAVSVLAGIGAFWTGQCACAGIGAGLNSTEQLALYNALRTYMTGVGVP